MFGVLHRNFHVWNELWTKRKDLSTVNYDGWQAVDSTPQETSFSLHQMGPAPLEAIKNGYLYIQYDVGFVFAEVNADYVKWIASKDASGNVVFKGMYKLLNCIVFVFGEVSIIMIALLLNPRLLVKHVKFPFLLKL